MTNRFAYFLGLTLLFLAPFGHAQSQIPPDCTTTEKIHFARTARVPQILSDDQVREVVLVALGYADVDASWVRNTFTGQWFFEFEDEFAMYAGFSVRSHYLQVAITLEDGKLTSVVCDSRNLKQKAGSIHRKVPGWKGTLDDNIRVALGQAAEYYRKNPVNSEEEAMAKELENLESLHRSGVLTDEEYTKLRQRVIDNF